MNVALVPVSSYHTPPRLTDPARALWVGLRFARAPIDLFDLAMPIIKAADASLVDLIRLLDRWVAGGWVRATKRPRQFALKPEFIMMAEPPELAAPTRRWRAPRTTQRQRIWHSMRVLRRFDFPTLVIAAQAKPTTVADLLRIFERGGWLRRDGDRWHFLSTKPAGYQVPTIARRWTDSGPVIRVSNPADGSVLDLPVQPRARRDRTPFLTGELNHVG